MSLSKSGDSRIADPVAFKQAQRQEALHVADGSNWQNYSRYWHVGASVNQFALLANGWVQTALDVGAGGGGEPDFLQSTVGG